MEYAKAMLLIFLVLSRVFTAICPNEDATALHAVFDKVSLVTSFVRPVIDTFTIDEVVLELTEVEGAIIEEERSDSLLLTLDKSTFET